MGFSIYFNTNETFNGLCMTYLALKMCEQMPGFFSVACYPRGSLFISLLMRCLMDCAYVVMCLDFTAHPRFYYSWFNKGDNICANIVG